MLQTERLLIRPIGINDAEAVFKYKSSKEITKFQGKSFDSIDEVKELINSNPTEMNIEDTWYQLVLIKRDSNEVIGDIGMHFIGPENMQLELGITIAQKHHKMGFASEAIKALLEYAFQKLNKHRVIASLDPENSASVSLFKSLNFRKEAHFKASYFQNGIWKDDLVYAMLKSEYK